MNSKIFKNRNFLIFFSSGFISAFGDSIYNIAIMWYILNTIPAGKSGIVLAIFTTSIILPKILFGPFIGVFIDKYDRKKIMIYSDLFRALLIGVLFVSIHFKFLPLIFIFITTFVSEAFTLLFSTTFSSSIINIIDEDLLLEANSMHRFINQISTVLGAAIAGVLYYIITFEGIMLLNALSFIVSGIALRFIEYRTGKEKVKKSGMFFSDFMEGLDYLKRNQSLLTMAVFSMIMNFVFVPIFSIIIPKIIKYDLNLSSKEFGLYEAVLSTGVILSCLIVPISVKRIDIRRIFFGSLFIRTILFILLGSIPLFLKDNQQANYSSFLILTFIVFLIAGINSFINLPIDSILQKSVENEYRGRFFGMYFTLKGICVPFGCFIFGIFSDYLNSFTIINITALVLLIVSFVMYRKKSVHNFVKYENCTI